MSNPESELLAASQSLLKFSDVYETSPETAVVNDLLLRAKHFDGSFSGSWIGYHANVYYKNFQTPPAGDHFNVEQGKGPSYVGVANPNWVECKHDDVLNLLLNEESTVSLRVAEMKAKEGLKLLTSVKDDVLSVSAVYLANHDDSFVRKLSDEIEKIEVFDAADIANEMSPRRKTITRDLRAAQQGIWVPPHIQVQARVMAAHQPSVHCRELARRIEKIAAHIARARGKEVYVDHVGTKIFIGHGRSFVWRDLKDFIKDRLQLPYEEFNRVPVAGITNIARLNEMLDAAACAFVIMTAEDEQSDGSLHARMNVIHEVGLFQGRLGFTKAIVLLEEGCEEFTNIQGLGQIRFPKGNISAKFEEIRQVLEREEILPSPK
ncbi:TIR domain-containing protein [Geomonas ferrireducens]|uniref:TIR domain-containing protein n=1 Tax=Geomonas ferrireducens TaxID=2570227 RepID=UPI0018E0BB3D|nr:TIR domain-containing protein [Geomonas ferrireducens]